MVAVRVDAVARETLESGTPRVRVTSMGREVLTSYTPHVRVDALAREALSGYTVNARISALVREALVSPFLPNIGNAAGHATVTGVATYASFGVSAGVATVHGITPPEEPRIGQAVGSSSVLGVAQPFSPQTPLFPLPLLQNQIKSYLYVWCNDDDNLQSMVATYNAYAQAYLDWFNAINLPIYTSGTISGPLLDWVATNLYGISRPGLPSPGTPGIGPFNTYTLDSLVFNGGHPGTPGTFYVTSDDYYRRILTWLFFKGDGKVFNVRWLKRRVERFLSGINGIDPGVSTTYDVSVVFNGPTTVTISIPLSAAGTILQAAVAAGVLELPFQINWTVVT